jgi:hypothetical protein
LVPCIFEPVSFARVSTAPGSAAFAETRKILRGHGLNEEQANAIIMAARVGASGHEVPHADIGELADRRAVRTLDMPPTILARSPRWRRHGGGTGAPPLVSPYDQAHTGFVDALDSPSDPPPAPRSERKP